MRASVPSASFVLEVDEAAGVVVLGGVAAGAATGVAETAEAVVAPDRKAARAAAEGLLALEADAPVGTAEPAEVGELAASWPSTPPSMAFRRAATPLASRPREGVPAELAPSAGDEAVAEEGVAAGGLSSSWASRSQRLPAPSFEMSEELPSIVWI